MIVGNPSVESVVHQMIADGVERIIVMPMFPQFSATTTAAAMDVLFKGLIKETRVPTIRVVPPYYLHPAYLESVVTIIQEEIAKLPWQPDHFVISFHGIPISYCKEGDYYATHVKRTTAALVKMLNWPRQMWTQTFQSLFGREEWLKPYTEEKLKQLAKEGKKRVFVVTPGFTVDCLETIDEIGREAREVFQHAGGAELYQCPCLNAHPSWIAAMREIILGESKDWIV